MEGQAIMVVPGDRQWTQQALHLACAMARDTDTAVVVVKMVCVNHPLRLDDPLGGSCGREDHCLWGDCAATAEFYGVPYQTLVFTYANFIPGLVSAAEQIEATAVFVPPLRSASTLWNRFLLWRLRRAFRQKLYTLETPIDQPAVTLPGSDPGSSILAPLAHSAGPGAR